MDDYFATSLYDDTHAVATSTTTPQTPSNAALVSSRFFDNPNRLTPYPIHTSNSSLGALLLQTRTQRVSFVTFKPTVFNKQLYSEERNVSIRASVSKPTQSFKLTMLKRAMGNRVTSHLKCRKVSCRTMNAAMTKHKNSIGELRLQCDNCKDWSSAQFCANDGCDGEMYMKNHDSGHYECPKCRQTGRRFNRLLYDSAVTTTTTTTTTTATTVTMKTETGDVTYSKPANGVDTPYKPMKVDRRCSDKNCPPDSLVDGEGCVSCSNCGLVAQQVDIQEDATCNEFEEEIEQDIQDERQFFKDNFMKDGFRATQELKKRVERQLAVTEVDRWRMEFITHLKEAWGVCSRPFPFALCKEAAELLVEYTKLLGSKPPHRLPQSSALYGACLYIVTESSPLLRKQYPLLFITDELMRFYRNPQKSTKKKKPADTASAAAASKEEDDDDDDGDEEGGEEEEDCEGKELKTASLTVRLNRLSLEINNVQNAVCKSDVLRSRYGTQHVVLYWEIIRELLADHCRNPLFTVNEAVRERINTEIERAQKANVESKHKPKTVAAAIFYIVNNRREVEINGKLIQMTQKRAEQMLKVCKVSMNKVLASLYPDRK